MKETDKVPLREKRLWSTRQLGSRLGYQIFYTMIRLGGRRTAYLGLYFVVSYYVLCRPSVRKSSRYYLTHRFPRKGRIARLADTFRIFLQMGKILIDRVTIGILGPATCKLEVHGREELLDLLSERKGIVLLMSHVGCWHVALSALRFLDRPVNLLLEYEAGEMERHYFEESGMDWPLKIIDPRSYLGGALEMLHVLRKGEILCVMGDRVSGSEKNSVKVEFLGEKALFPFSVYKIASAADVPVVVFFPHKTGIDSYTLHVARIIRVPKDLGRAGEHYLPYVREYVEEIERYVGENPYQFFNFYNLWE